MKTMWADHKFADICFETLVRDDEELGVVLRARKIGLTFCANLMIVSGEDPEPKKTRGDYRLVIGQSALKFCL